MSDEAADDVVRVASGTGVQVKLWQGALADAGIRAHIVGGDLTTGLGTALPTAIELWVLRADFDRATEVLVAEEASLGHPPA